LKNENKETSRVTNKDVQQTIKKWLMIGGFPSIEQNLWMQLLLCRDWIHNDIKSIIMSGVKLRKKSIREIVSKANRGKQKAGM
jgi:hypothetical protein